MARNSSASAAASASGGGAGSAIRASAVTGRVDQTRRASSSRPSARVTRAPSGAQLRRRASASSRTSAPAPAAASASASQSWP